VYLYVGFSAYLSAQEKTEKVNASKCCIEMTPQLFKQAICSGQVMLIDVRMLDEYVQSRIKGAKSAPTKEQLLQMVKYLPLQTNIYVYCKKGKERMYEAATVLHQQGFINIYCLKGGFDEWQKLKLPVDESEIQ
jgi:rhodanese-related sulfurtransferase